MQGRRRGATPSIAEAPTRSFDGHTPETPLSSQDAPVLRGKERGEGHLVVIVQDHGHALAEHGPEEPAGPSALPPGHEAESGAHAPPEGLGVGHILADVHVRVDGRPLEQPLPVSGPGPWGMDTAVTDGRSSRCGWTRQQHNIFERPLPEGAAPCCRRVENPSWPPLHRSNPDTDAFRRQAQMPAASLSDRQRSFKLLEVPTHRVLSRSIP